MIVSKNSVISKAPKFNKLYVALSLLGLFACSKQEPETLENFPSNFNWINEPAIKVRVDSDEACVPRQFLNPNNEFPAETIINTNGTTKSISANSALGVTFTAFLPEFNGYTKDIIVNQFENKENLAQRKKNLIHITFFNTESASYYSKYNQFKGFESTTVIDNMGFSTRKRNKNCSENTFNASPTIGLPPDKYCALDQIKFGNKEVPNLTLICTPSPGSNRCFAETLF